MLLRSFHNRLTKTQSVLLKVTISALCCVAVKQVHAAPPKLSVCPPVIGERETMLASVSNIGTQRRYGELCRVAKPVLESKTARDLSDLRPCLQELGVKEVEIGNALKRGAPAADKVFSASQNKDLLCQRTREEFDQ